MHHREAEPRPLRARREEGLEETGQHVLRDAGPVVGHRDQRLVGLVRGAEPDAPRARAQRLAGVEQQVHEDVLEELRVGAHERAVGDHELDAMALQVGLLGERAQDALAELLQLERRGARPRRLRERKQVADRLVEAAHLALDLLHDLGARVVALEPAPEDLHGAADARERVLDLVGHRRRHLADRGEALAPVQLLADAVALRDVPDDRRPPRVAPLRVAEHGRRDLAADAAAVARDALAGVGAQDAALVRAAAKRVELALRVVAGRVEERGVLAEDLLLLPAEDLLGPAVPRGDAVVDVERQDAVDRGVEDVGEEQPVALELPLVARDDGAVHPRRDVRGEEGGEDPLEVPQERPRLVAHVRERLALDPRPEDEEEAREGRAEEQA
ncbi:MAG: hypothetical protein L6Q95_14740, partial [Planctomycetes bacterium]|nr:hypothetical protein [Planctomycetota bacterium]